MVVGDEVVPPHGLVAEGCASARVLAVALQKCLLRSLPSADGSWCAAWARTSSAVPSSGGRSAVGPTHSISLPLTKMAPSSMSPSSCELQQGQMDARVKSGGSVRKERRRAERARAGGMKAAGGPCPARPHLVERGHDCTMLVQRGARGHWAGVAASRACFHQRRAWSARSGGGRRVGCAATELVAGRHLHGTSPCPPEGRTLEERKGKRVQTLHGSGRLRETGVVALLLF